MRVLFCSSEFWPARGGRGIFATRLVPDLRCRGYDIRVLTLQNNSHEPTDDTYQAIPVSRIPFPTALGHFKVERWMAMRRWLANLKRETAPNLVHIHGFDPWLVLLHLETAKRFPIPWVFTLTEELPRAALQSGLFARALGSADWITGKCLAVLSQARQIAPEIERRSSVVYNGLEVPDLAPAPLRFGRLLGLGRLVRQKGFDLVLTALPSIIKRFPEARLVIAGDGPERPRLERQTADLDLGKFVHFSGWIAPDKVPELINAASLALIPSRWEGLPSVALQASVMARPVVAASVGGLPEAVIDDSTGLLVEPNDSSKLSAAICSLLEQPQRAREMGQTGRLRVEELFRWDRCVDGYAALYHRLGRDLSDSETRCLP